MLPLWAGLGYQHLRGNVCRENKFQDISKGTETTKFKYVFTSNQANSFKIIKIEQFKNTKQY